MAANAPAGQTDAPPSAPEAPPLALPPDAAMLPLDPAYVQLLRIRTGLTGLVLAAAVSLADFLFFGEAGLPRGLAGPAALAIAVAALIVLPRRRYRAWGWREEADELHIRHGLLIRSRTVVPFGRVTHIDISQGPLERGFGLATLIVHTAGTRAASVPLPGLAAEAAEGLRDRIRARIRLDLA